MPCYYPMTGYRSRSLGKNGKRPVVFDAKQGFIDLPVTVSCGQCIGCLLERSRQWAVRCVHEAQLHDENCFVTLTYRDECLPEHGTLVKKDFQLFMKRLRAKYGRPGVKFFQCGEYGEKYQRPHYHACLFGHSFEDLQLFKVERGVELFVSDSLGALWPFGFSTVGSVTFESAAYVARYCLKKTFSEEDLRTPEDWKRAKARRYERIDPATGEVVSVVPEYTTMSRGGRDGRGIAFDWYKQFKEETYRDDFVVLRGKKLPPPRYYDSLFEVTDPEAFAAVKKERVRKAKAFRDNNTPERLVVREHVKKAQVNQLKRCL